MFTFTDDDPAYPIVPVRVESLRPSQIPPTSHLNIQPYDEPQTSGSAPGLSPPSYTTSPALTSAQSHTTVTSPSTTRSIVTTGKSSAQISLISSLGSESTGVGFESLPEVPISYAKEDQRQTNSVAGDFVVVDESVSDDIMDSEGSLSDGEFEEDESSLSVEDFPMSLNFHPSALPSVYSVSMAPDVRSEYTVNAASSEVNLTVSTVSFRFSNPLNNSQPQPHHKQKQSLDSTTSLRPQFPQPPLLASNFPMTTVQVSHSSIRPNDRGKEVLSFVITVDPGSGKESWRIEKVYSDFIWLDQKIRSANRHLARWMPSLPDSRLWHDRAPAKVDRRKASPCFRGELCRTHVPLLICEGCVREVPPGDPLAPGQRPKRNCCIFLI